MELTKSCFTAELVDEIAKARPTWSFKKCKEAFEATLAGIEGAAKFGYARISFKNLFVVRILNERKYVKPAFHTGECNHIPRKSLKITARKKMERILIELEARK